ncbi:MAG: efflux RND transporter periplasmic adaptor subunit [Planctomycetota bacterium]|jgi:multidrug efflux pump subunit AcrA (membrane-fusion protein)
MKFPGNLLSQAPLVFVVLTLALLWATGTLHFGPPEETPGAESQADAHAGHDHGPGGGDESPAASCENPKHDHGSDWCAEHGVAESACTRCDPSLVASFKARGDWCAEHDLPESQCPACQPGLLAPTSPVAGSLDALETVNCEHGTPAIDCDGCRFEVGVVKVERSLADALLAAGKVEKREASQELLLTGAVQLARTRVVTVATTAAGRVLEVRVDLGKTVAPGDLLAVIHSGEFGEAKASYLQATTTCEIARRERERQTGVTAALDELLRSLGAQPARENSHEECRFELPPGLVGERKSKLVGAAARLRLAHLKHEREMALEKKGISSRAEHEAAHQEHEAAQVEYTALLEEVKLSLHLEMARAENTFKQACTTVLAAEQQLRVLGMDAQGIAKLRDAEAGDDFARLEVRAPRAGTITALELAPGRYVEANESLFTIADLSQLWVWCDLYERDLAVVAREIANGGFPQAEVRVAAFPDEAFEGVLDLIGSEVDEHTRTIKARIQVANRSGRLRPGTFARVVVRVPTGKRVPMVPRSAVLSDDGKTFLFQHWRDDLWVRRDVVVRGTSTSQKGPRSRPAGRSC